METWPFGNLGISILTSTSKLTSALTSAFKYKHCLLRNINHVLNLYIYFLSPIEQLAICSVMSHDNI